VDDEGEAAESDADVDVEAKSPRQPENEERTKVDADFGDSGEEQTKCSSRNRRRMSKKERKREAAERKARSKCSPDWATLDPQHVPSDSSPRTSLQSSPVLVALQDVHIKDEDVSNEELEDKDKLPPSEIEPIQPACWDSLPPPAVPVDEPDVKSTHAAREEQPCAVEPTLQEAHDLDPGVEEDESRSRICIDVKWQWCDIQEVMSRVVGCGCGKPLVVNQKGLTPFGSTYFYAFPGLAFEVMKNGFVASLTVFSVPPEDLPASFQVK